MTGFEEVEMPNENEKNRSTTDEKERYRPEDGAPQDKDDKSLPKDVGNPTN